MKISHVLLQLLPIVLIGTLAAQCQSAPANQTPPPDIPTPASAPLFPPLQPGDGTDLLDQILQTGVIRVGIRVWPHADFSPPAFRGYSNAETGGALNGFEVDLARWIAVGLGVDLEFVEAYPPVLSTGDWRGQWDIAFGSLVPFDHPPGIVHTPLAFSTPYVYMPMSFLTPKVESSPPTLIDLTGKQIGVLEYSAYHDLILSPNLTVAQQPLLTALPELQAVPVSNMSNAIRQLGQPDAAPPLDALFGPMPIFQAAIQENWPVQLTVQPEIVGYQPLAIAAVPRDNLHVDRLLTEIDRILNQLHQQGTLAEIHFTWYGQDFSQSPPTE